MIKKSRYMFRLVNSNLKICSFGKVLLGLDLNLICNEEILTDLKMYLDFLLILVNPICGSGQLCINIIIINFKMYLFSYHNYH